MTAAKKPIGAPPEYLATLAEPPWNLVLCAQCGRNPDWAYRDPPKVYAIVCACGLSVHSQNPMRCAEIWNRLELRGNPSMTLEQAQQHHVRAVLVAQNRNRSRAAKVLGIHRKSLYRWLVKLGGAL